jgi:hypothetical protein
VPLRNGVISLWTENVHTDRPTRTALLWRDLAADTTAVLGSWDGQRWVDYGGRMLAPSLLFGPRVIAALAPDGRFAVGDGVEYCVRLWSVAEGTFRMACREHAPVPIGAGIRSHDLSRIEDEARRESLAGVVRGQEIADHLASFDRLLFDDDGHLWVRTLGPELADVHPYLRSSMLEREPAYRTWDVFDPVGRFVGGVAVPSNFRPQSIESGYIYGFLELATGEITIGRAAVPLLQGDTLSPNSFP